MRLRGGAGAREDVRLWVTCECVSVCAPSKIGKRVCARRAPGERQAGGEQHLTRKRKSRETRCHTDTGDGHHR